MPSSAPKQDRLAFIDVLRGIAAMLVVLEHALILAFPAYLDWSVAWFDMGQCGVTLFLILSGFVIPASLERCGSNGRFWVQRFFRLFPLYWTSIALTYIYYWLATASSGGQPFETKVWLINLTMLQEFLRVPHVNGVFWTLTLELMLYASFSFLYSLGLLRKYIAITWLGILGLLAAGLVCPLLAGIRFPAGYAFLYLSAFAGHVLYRRLAGQVGIGQTAALLTGLGLVGALTSFVNFHLLSRVGLPFSWGCVVACWVAAYAAFGAFWHFRNATFPRSLRVLGKVSYSIYLLHPLVLMILPLALPWPVYLGCAIVLTFALSLLTYRLIEEPCMRLGKSLTRQRDDTLHANETPHTRQAA